MPNMRYTFKKYHHFKLKPPSFLLRKPKITQKLFTVYVRPYLKNWMASILSIPKNKHNSKTSLFYFESICVPSEELKPTETKTWIGKHKPISVSISCNLLDKPMFLREKDPQFLIIDFVANLELLAEKIKWR